MATLTTAKFTRYHCFEVTGIYWIDDALSFLPIDKGDPSQLATLEQFSDRSQSIFTELNEGEIIELAEGFFVLDANLNVQAIASQSLVTA